MKSQANAEILRLFLDDRQDRQSQFIEWDAVGPRDRQRLLRIKELYRGRLVRTPEEMYWAAMVLHHGSVPDDYRLAHDLSSAAMLAGYVPAVWLCAASEDRLLVSHGKLQKFGTQYRVVGRCLELHPVDPSTTDEERATYNVPSLVELKDRVEV